jgi:hypothetical protein
VLMIAIVVEMVMMVMMMMAKADKGRMRAGADEGADYMYV